MTTPLPRGAVFFLQVGFPAAPDGPLRCINCPSMPRFENRAYALFHAQAHRSGDVKRKYSDLKKSKRHVPVEW